jgi:hypothetical protein
MSRRYRTSSLLEFNLKQYLEREFVNNGFYFNVASGQLAVDGSRADVLRRVTGSIYESFTNNWISATDAVGDSGFEVINASGVYINGTFHVRGSSPHEPIIDYKNGRILFNGTQPSTTDEVSAEFSYHQIAVDFPNEEIVNLLFSDIRDNVESTPHGFPSGNQRQLPVVVIDLQTAITTPGELGGGKNVNKQVVFHVLSTDRNELNAITDFLHDNRSFKTIQGVDFNLAPQLFTVYGDRANTYKNYTELQASGNIAWRKIYVNEARIREKVINFKLHRSRIDWDVDLLFLPSDGG